MFLIINLYTCIVSVLLGKYYDELFSLAIKGI